MAYLKYIVSALFGAVSALIIGQIWRITGSSTTVDAWLVSFTISGHDVGDRLLYFLRDVITWDDLGHLTGYSHFFANSLSEELVKFLMFIVAFVIMKPISIRQIIFMGISVGIGFSLCENFTYNDGDYLFSSLLVRSTWHALFTGILTMLFWYWYYSQLRWIDAGAKENIVTSLLRYSELVILVFWTVVWLIISAFLHAIVNILFWGGNSIISGVWVLIISWFLFGKALVQPGSRKPYGALIQEVHLLQTISEAQKDLTDIQKKTGKMSRN